jgi:hypothetical protein
MTDTTVLNQILQNQQEHAKALGGMSERINSLDKKVEDNTVITKDIQVKTYNLNSWKDGIIHMIVDEKEKAVEAVNKRLIPIEEHVKNHKVMNAETHSTWLDIIKHGITALITLILGYIGITIQK